MQSMVFKIVSHSLEGAIDELRVYCIEQWKLRHSQSTKVGTKREALMLSSEARAYHEMADLLGNLTIELTPEEESKVDESTKEARKVAHDLGHGTYHPGPCEECLALGWKDIA